MINGGIVMLQGRSLVSIDDLNKEEILEILDQAEEFSSAGVDQFNSRLSNKIIASLFFEPSTRTRLSFETATNRLGARVIGFSDSASTSGKKGETLEDTIRMVSGYADAIIMRHPEPGSAKRAEMVSGVPVINAGDGANEHPTQTLLDLFSIRKTQGTLDNLTIGFIGDLRFGRTVHSLAKALAKFEGNQLVFTAPDQLTIPDELRNYLQASGVSIMETEDLSLQLDDLDIGYMTRIQKERFSADEDYQKLKGVYLFGRQQLDQTKDNFRLLHPLPRVDEISSEIDDDPKSYYFEQATNGVPVRMALLSKILS